MATPTVTNPLQGTMPIRTPLVDGVGTMSFPWIKWFQQFLQSKFPTVPAFFSDTHQARAAVSAAGYANGSLYFETDRRVWYVAIGGVWTYMAGVYSATQAQIPADLGSGDAGFQMSVTDYGHFLVWDGTQWGFGNGDDGSGYIVQFIAAPVQYWAPCDGTRALTLLSSGQLAFVTTPNTPGSYLRI